MAKNSTIDSEEIRHFTKDAGKWWDENGPFKPLHRLNPVRMGYIKGQICGHYGRNEQDIKALKGLNVLDIGCGGGLVCEPLARMGAKITGIDADDIAITIAKEHADGLNIHYICGDAANLKEKFDVVTALEVIEHVSDIEAFMKTCADRLKPGGILVMSTLNRTAKSYALGIVAAEYILRWVPRGTHQWKKFLKPSEIARYGRNHGLQAGDIRGLVFDPFQNRFSLSGSDLDVNYIMTLKDVRS